MILFKVLLFILFVQLYEQYEYSDFIPRAFKINPQEGVYDIEIGLGKDHDSVVKAIGDFNGDKQQNYNKEYILLFSYSQDLLVVEKGYFVIRYWDEGETYKFSKKQKLPLSSKKVLNVQLGDFDQNGLLDIMLVYAQEQSSGGLKFNFYLQASRGNYELSSLTFKSWSMPTQVDLIGDQTLQLLYTEKSNKRIVGRMVNKKWVTKKFSDFLSQTDGCLSESTQVISVPHWNHFLDLNGDCMIDLVVTSTLNNNQYVEIYLRQSDNLFCLSSNQNYGQKVKSFKFIDINYDGGIDMVILNQANQKDFLNTYYNTQVLKPDILCRSLSKKELTQSPFRKDFDQSQELPFKLGSVDDEPIILQFGDMNRDGYMDLLVMDYTSKSSIKPVYLENNGQDHQKLVYDSNDDLNKHLSSSKGTSVAFLDIGEDGQLDILTVSKTETKALLYYRTSDTYFMKVNIANGVDTSSMGNNIVGATVQCVVTTLDQKHKVVVINQSPQSAYNSLQLPYIHFGLGRTNNYVENLNVGIVNQNYGQKKKWSPIIPNTQFLIYPFSQNVENWKIAIYLQPTTAVQIIIITISILLIVLGAAIMYLHIQEKKDDKKNQIDVRSVFN